MGDVAFLRTFLPYELRLAQRRALVWGSGEQDQLPAPFLGLCLLRLESRIVGERIADPGGSESPLVSVSRLVREVLRDSDVPVEMPDGELLAIVRDLDPEKAYVVAQRLLSAAARSSVLGDAGLRVRVGYVVYPLSSKPDLPPWQWPSLLDLARMLSSRDAGGAPSSGYGLIGVQDGLSVASMPESDLIPLLLRDLDSLAGSGIVQVQRVRVLVGM